MMGEKEAEKPEESKSSQVNSAAADHKIIAGKKQKDIAGNDQTNAGGKNQNNIAGADQTSAGGSNRALALQLIALFVVSTLVVWGTLASDKQLDKVMPEARTFASINNMKPSGMSAFFELCGLAFKTRPVAEWAYPYRKLRGSTRAGIAGVDKGVLIIVSPDESLAEFEVEDILDWVRLGNALVYLDNFQFRNTKRLLEKIDIGARELDESIVNKQSDARTDLPYYAHLRVLNVSAQQKLSGGKPLVSVDKKAVIVEKQLGKGRILIASCPQLVINKQISLAERWSNFQFMHNWLATTSGEILFDEKCHGSTKGVNVIYYFLHGPSGFVVLQLILILVLAILSAHQRFGAALSLRNARRISNLEHIEGLSNTYYRADARQAVLSIIWLNVRQKLCKLLQISPREEDDKLNSALATQQKLGGSGGTGLVTAGNVVELVQKCEQAVNRKELTDEELRELVTACDKISEQADELLTTRAKN